MHKRFTALGIPSNNVPVFLVVSVFLPELLIMRQLSEQEALYKLTAMCSSAEHCSFEMLEKLRKWDIADDAQARIMQHLTQERYIDDERFCRFFVRDKIRYNKWGRRKVEQALYAKRIPEDISRAVLDEVDDREYMEILRPLINNKRKSTKAGSEYELNGKLVRFAIGRGFTMDIIRQCLDNTDDYDCEEYD